MAPVSHGTMLASARQGVDVFSELKVLFLGGEVSNLVHAIDILHDYIEDIGRSDARILLYTVISDIDTQNSQNVSIITLDTQNKAVILQYAKDNNIDIIHDSNRIFTKKEIFKNKDSFLITHDAVEATVQLESYLTGHLTVWNFADPVWHTNWIYKYTHQAGVSVPAFTFISTGQTKGFSQKQMEYVRALANKAMHIEHAREQLYFYLQLKRRANRAGNTNNTFSFELTYHLTNYSIYICSALDILARLINDRYDLGYTRYQSFSVAKEEFLRRLSPKRKTLADIFARKKFQKWADWMFVRRNHITHESNLYLTPMLMERKDRLSDEELERRVDAEFDWSLYENATPPIDISGMRAAVKQNIDLQLNYREVVTDMMTLEREDRSTGNTQRYIIFPLRSIDEDFEKINDTLTRVIANLSKARS